MKKYLIMLFFLISTSVNASHFSAANIWWVYLGNNKYQVYFDFYRDCGGIPAPSSPVLEFDSPCSNEDTTLTLTEISDVQEVSSCYEGVTTCNGGTAYGIEKHEYTGTITLPSKCSDWSISYDLCCRSAFITNLNDPSATTAYIYAVLNNKDGDNSSPTFANSPVSFVCIDSALCIDNGTTGGDSVVYQLVNPMATSSIPVVFIGGYTYLNPISSSTGFNFDNTTGKSCIDPDVQQVCAMAVTVSNYINGVLSSEIEIDEQIVVEVCDCSSALPVTFLSFSGEPGANAINLGWSTAAEINNNYFEVEKMYEGEFLVIKKIPGSGTTDALSEYTCTDDRPTVGSNIYRLSQTDYDGHKVYLGNPIDVNYKHDIRTFIEEFIDGYIMIQRYNDAGQLVR